MNTKEQYGRQLAWIVEQMDKKLEKNLHKGGWDALSPLELQTLLNKEFDDLDSAGFLLSVQHSLDRDVKDEATDVIEICANIANFSMMIAERVNAIFLGMYDEGEVK